MASVVSLQIHLMVVLMVWPAFLHGQMEFYQPQRNTNQDQNQCRYEFVVQGGCTQTDQSLQEKLSLMKIDIDRGRLSQITQNSAVQSQLFRMKADIDRMALETDTLKTQLQFPLSHNGVDKQDLTQLQKDVFSVNSLVVGIRDRLDQDIKVLQEVVESVNTTLAVERLERYKIEISLQAQLTGQNKQLVDIAARLAVLEQQASAVVMNATGMNSYINPNVTTPVKTHTTVNPTSSRPVYSTTPIKP